MFGFLKKRPKPRNLAEAIAQSNFIDATVKEVPKKLGLTHAPKVQNTVDEYNGLHFNQRTELLNRTLKKGLKKVAAEAEAKRKEQEAIVVQLKPDLKEAQG